MEVSPATDKQIDLWLSYWLGDHDFDEIAEMVYELPREDTIAAWVKERWRR